MNRPQYDIAPPALMQIKRIGDVVRIVLHRATESNANTVATASDVAAFSRLMALIDCLPEPLPGEDITLSIFTSQQPTAPFKRLQFGEKVIEIGDMQIHPHDDSAWTATRVFGGILGLGAGCRDDRLVNELGEWIDELIFESRESMVGWRIDVGNEVVGHMQYPRELDDE